MPTLKYKSNLSRIALLAASQEGLDGVSGQICRPVHEFITSEWGLGYPKALPQQLFILKVLYNTPLDDSNKTIEVRDKFNERVVYTFTELEFLKYLHREGRCNVGPDDYLSRHYVELVNCCGRRSTKTTCAQLIMTYEAYRLICMGNPQRHYRIDEDNEIALTNVAINLKDSRRFHRQLIRRIVSAPFFQSYYRDLGSAEITGLATPADIERQKANPMDTRCSIVLMSVAASGASARGPGNIVACMDEQAYMRDTDSDFSDDAVYEALTPSTSEFTDPVTGLMDSKILNLSSPGSKSGTFFNRYTAGMSGQDNTVLVIQAPTWEMNPRVSSEILRKAWARGEDFFWREYGAKFCDRVSPWVPDDLIDRCVDKSWYAGKTNVRTRYPCFAGLDLGFINDGTAISVVHYDVELKKYVIDFYDVFYAGMEPFEDCDVLDFDVLSDIITKVSRDYDIKDGVFDQASGVPLFQRLNKKGLNQYRMVFFTDSLNSQIYEVLKSVILSQDIMLPDDDLLIPELKRLQKDVRSRVRTIVEAPSGSHDDLSDSLARAIWACSEKIGGMARKQILGPSSAYSQLASIERRREMDRRFRDKKVAGRMSGRRQLPMSKSGWRGGGAASGSRVKK